MFDCCIGCNGGGDPYISDRDRFSGESFEGDGDIAASGESILDSDLSCGDCFVGVWL